MPRYENSHKIVWHTSQKATICKSAASPTPLLYLRYVLCLTAPTLLPFQTNFSMLFNVVISPSTKLHQHLRFFVEFMFNRCYSFWLTISSLPDVSLVKSASCLLRMKLRVVGLVFSKQSVVTPSISSLHEHTDSARYT